MTGGPALATDELQQQELSRVQWGEVIPSATAATRLAGIPPPAGRGRRMTTPARTSADEGTRPRTERGPTLGAAKDGVGER